jgi:hypothetical protein
MPPVSPVSYELRCAQSIKLHAGGRLADGFAHPHTAPHSQPVSPRSTELDLLKAGAVGSKQASALQDYNLLAAAVQERPLDGVTQSAGNGLKVLETVSLLAAVPVAVFAGTPRHAPPPT